MGVMHRIITILVTLPDLTICPAEKRDGKRKSGKKKGTLYLKTKFSP